MSDLAEEVTHLQIKEIGVVILPVFKTVMTSLEGVR